MTEDDKGLIKIDNPADIVNFLQAPTTKVAEALTGILASSPPQLVLSIGRLVQASIQHTFLRQFGKEIEEYIKKGQIKEDYFATSRRQTSLLELLKFIDGDIPDEERFEAIKSIFFVSISKDATQNDEELAYQFIQICKKLNSGDLLVLKAAYEIVNGRIAFDYNGDINLKLNSAGEWFTIISKQIGHNILPLVEMHEDNLVELKLITNRTHTDKSGILPTPYLRLTTLGYKLCEFIARYEQIKNIKMNK